MRAGIRLGGAAVCFAAAVLLVLLALDAHAWSSRFPADDLRYRHDASASGLWRVHDLSPARVDRAVLGIDDDVSYRHALRDFRLARATELVGGRLEMTNRVQALIDLTGVVNSRIDPARRAQAENLLGVLGFGISSQDVGQRETFFNNGLSAPRAAIALDPTNDDAPFNLEYALDQLVGPGQQQIQGSGVNGGKGSAGHKPPGHGY